MKYTEVKVKQIGKNLITVINVTKDSTEVESIKNKVKIYNKKLDEKSFKIVINIFDKTKIEKENKINKAKGIKKAIKKIEKVTKKKPVIKASSSSLIDIVVDEHKSGNLTQDDIKRLEDLLSAKKEELLKEQKPQTSTPRQGEY